MTVIQKKGHISMLIIYMVAGFLLCHAIISIAMTLISFKEQADEINSKNALFSDIVFNLNVQIVSLSIYILIVYIMVCIWPFNIFFNCRWC